mmetsp:Transcript_70006/g.116651  ORF Transcript_70006/g.116651 Transcript_70006/m.116651 type:complete len:207 (+) Transcript_70006:1502-2122(+)
MPLSAWQKGNEMCSRCHRTDPNSIGWRQQEHKKGNPSRSEMNLRLESARQSLIQTAQRLSTMRPPPTLAIAFQNSLHRLFYGLGATHQQVFEGLSQVVLVEVHSHHDPQAPGPCPHHHPSLDRCTAYFAQGVAQQHENHRVGQHQWGVQNHPQGVSSRHETFFVASVQTHQTLHRTLIENLCLEILYPAPAAAAAAPSPAAAPGQL